MTKRNLVRLLMMTVIMTALGVSAWPVSAVANPLTNLNNRHNLSSNATHGGRRALSPLAGGTDQICIFCHVPHSAAPQSTLWSRPDPNTATFPLYAQPLAIKGNVPGFNDPTAPSRSQYTNTDPMVTYPSGASRLCLSCHDGITAIGILRNNETIAMVGGSDFVPATAVIDLSTSHPISFVYNAAVLADVLAARGIGTYQLPSPVDAVDTPLDGMSRMQCTTCHDPHDDAAEFAGLPPFWRQTSGADPYNDVCNACHIAPPIGSPPLHQLP